MTQDEFFARAIPEPNSGCWLWEGRVDGDGYGRLGNNTKAHRLSYELYCAPIPPGMKIMHSCDQPGCVNPEHLRPGTDMQNATDRAKKLRGFRKLTEAQVLEIKSDNRGLKELSAEYGVVPQQIWNIKAGKYWKYS